jgi:predicted amidohydrolase YtcJ
MKLICLVISVLFLVVCVDTSEYQDDKTEAPASSIYINANIYPLDEVRPWAKAMITRDGIISYVGNVADAKKHADVDTVTYGIYGRFIMPGLIDTHTHLGLVATYQVEDASEQSLPQDSKESLFKLLEEYVDDNWLTSPVVLEGWDVNSFLPNDHINQT